MGRLGNSCVCTAVRSDVLRSRCRALRNARIADDAAVVVMDDIVVWTAPMGLFETADGHVNIAASGDTMFARFCGVAARHEWLADPRLPSDQARFAHRAEVTQ